MIDETQPDLLSDVDELRIMQMLLADLHDDLAGKVARFLQLNDLSVILGKHGTMLPGGETTYAAWLEARSSFVHGNFVATVMLCQGLAEHVPAAELSLSLHGEELPKKISFSHTIELCVDSGFIPDSLVNDLRRLMGLRNPLSHFRSIDDPSNLSRRILDTMESAQAHLFADASFAIGVAVRLLALPIFRVDG